MINKQTALTTACNIRSNAIHLLNDSVDLCRIRSVRNFSADERFHLAPKNSRSKTRFKREENVIAEFSCHHTLRDKTNS